MKRGWFIIPMLIMLLVLIESCEKETGQNCSDSPNVGICIDPAWVDSLRMCPQNYDPVCGCNGLTYSNECAAESNGVTGWLAGRCCD